MKYSMDMLLDSESGYYFPFFLDDNENVIVILDYGEQIHPMTGEKFFHHGMDFAAKGKELFALASGMVTGVGENKIHGQCIVVRYGNYFVTYGHIKEALKDYGDIVKAGDVIAKSGDFLHMGVKFKGEDLDPNEFLDMLNANVMQLSSIGTDPAKLAEYRPAVRTEYDADEKNITPIINRYFSLYLKDLQSGDYRPSPEFEEKLRNLFASSSSQNYFYEEMPTVANPLGITKRAAPLASKATDLVMTDFLHYAAVKHNVFVPGWSAEQKKKLFRKALDFQTM